MAIEVSLAEGRLRKCTFQVGIECGDLLLGDKLRNDAIAILLQLIEPLRLARRSHAASSIPP